MAKQLYQWRDPKAPAKPKITDTMGNMGPAANDFSQQATQQAGQQAAQTSGANQFATTIKPVQGSQAPKGPTFSQMLSGAQPQRQQALGQSYGAISDMLTQTGPSKASEFARSQFGKQAQEVQRQAAEQSALAGRLGTGQIAGDKFRIGDQLLMQRGDLEAQLAAQDEQQQLARRQAGISSLLGLEQLGQQERMQEAQLSMEERKLAQQASQFTDRLDFDRWATQVGLDENQKDRVWQASQSALERGSREKIAFAGLSLEEQALAQEASQFTDRLEFDRWATQAGLDENQADRIWQANQAELERGSREKIAFAGLDLQEQELAQDAYQFESRQDFDRWATQAGLDENQKDRIWQATEAEKNRAWEAGESALDRAINESQFAQRLGLDQAALTEQIRQFDSKQDFDRWAEENQLSEAEKNRVWQSNENDINRKYQTGERLSAQEHEVLRDKLRFDHENALTERNHVLGLDTLAKQQAFDQSMLELKNTYDDNRFNKQLSHEEAMAEFQRETQELLQAQGYSQQEALQASRLQADAIEKARDREMTEKLQSLDLAMRNDWMQEELGIKKDQLATNKKQVAQDMKLQLEQFGLTKRQADRAIQNDEIARNMDMYAAILSMPGADKNDDMLAKAQTTMNKALLSAGVITKDEFDMGELTSKAATFSNGNDFLRWAENQSGANSDNIMDAYNEFFGEGGQPKEAPTATENLKDATPEEINDLIETGDILSEKEWKPGSIKANGDIEKFLNAQGIVGWERSDRDSGDGYLIPEDQAPTLMYKGKPIKPVEFYTYKEGRGFMNLDNWRVSKMVYKDPKTGKKKTAKIAERNL